MPGFIAHIGNSDIKFLKERRQKLVVNSIKSEKYQIERRVVNKFMNDRLFADLEDFLVVVEGVVLNNHELEKQYKTSSWIDCVVEMYKINGDDFFKDFRGSFSGIFYDKKQEKWLIYTNHISDKQVFLYKITDNDYIFSSEIGFIVDTCKLNKLPLTIDKEGSYMSLTFGFCIEDATLIKEIKKLCAGHYYKLEKCKLEEIQYHRFSNKPKPMTQKEAVEGIDKYFRQAIKRAFAKDKEYGYKHIACLSGGLDSRMTVMVAHEMGYTEQLNITYSESGYLDFSIAQQIATDLHHDWLFKPLDGGDCIRDIDEVSAITYGSANFFGLAHGLSMERLINYDSFGIIHTGQLGDVIIGSYLKKMEYGQKPKITDGAYSEELRERIESYKLKYDYEDAELFMMYNRGFCGISQGLLTFQENSESYSPFTDVDFFEFCYNIPLELRFNHKIYFDWILDKYPNAANYIWENTRKMISRIENHKQRTMNVLGYTVPHFTEFSVFKKYMCGFIRRRLGLQKKGEKRKTITLSSKFDMSPIDYWYKTNPFIKEFMNNYWEENKHLIVDKQLSDDMNHLFNDCVLLDKLQAISVLSTIKLINS